MMNDYTKVKFSVLFLALLYEFGLSPKSYCSESKDKVIRVLGLYEGDIIMIGLCDVSQHNEF